MQNKIFNRLKKVIELLNVEIDYSFGFGSFWQNFDKYTKKSDIDFLVIINQEPNIQSLKNFYDSIEKLNIEFNCKCSPQIFVGKYEDLFCCTENILRLLTICDKKNNIIELYNDNNYNFYLDIKMMRIDILEISKNQISNIVRFYNRDFYKFKNTIDIYRYREVKFLFDAIYSYYKLHPTSKNAKYLILEINKYYKNYDKYINYILFHEMLINLVRVVNGE